MDDQQWRLIAPGVRRRTVASGDQIHQIFVQLDEGAVVPIHQHVHEQVAFVVSGRLRFLLPDGPREVGPGESVMLPSNLPHGVEVIEPATVIDTFSPPREDMLQQDREAM